MIERNHFFLKMWPHLLECSISKIENVVMEVVPLLFNAFGYVSVLQTEMNQSFHQSS